MKKLILSLSLIAMATACSPAPEKEAVKDPNEKPTQEKLSAFEGSLESIARIESAVALLHNESVSINDDLVTEIKSKINTADCVIVFNRPSVDRGSRISEMKISGSKCAIQADYVVSYQMQSNSIMTYSLKADFKINDPLIKAKNLVSEMNLRGTGRITSANEEISHRLSYTGSFVSTETGKVMIDVKQSENSSSLNPSYQSRGTTTYKLSFPSVKKVVDEKEVSVPGYQIEIKKIKDVLENKDKSRHMLNGDLINKSDYESYVKLFGMLAMPN